MVSDGTGSNIPEGWEEKTLGEVVTFQRGYDLPLKEIKNGPYPILMSNGIGGFHNEYRAKGPGVTIGRSGNLGLPIYCESDYWPHNTTLFSKEFHRSYPKFVYYLIKSLDLSIFNAGSAVPTLNRNHIHTFLVRVPRHIHEQIAISKILSNLDSKIELNQQMNRKLEAIGQALFKHWFVDFEFPDEQGRPYRSSGGKIVESELGEIPEGWEVSSIYDIADVVYGAPYSSKQFNKERRGLPLIRIRDLETQLPEFYTEEKHEKSTVIKAGDLIIGMDAVFRPYIWVGPESLLNQRLCLFKPVRTIIHNYFIKESIKPILTFYEKSKVGTTVIHLGKADIDSWKVVIPDDRCFAMFKEIINPIVLKIINNASTNNTLIQIRDGLLPKLMSGKIRVPVSDSASGSS